jgi:hypothetical protein
VVEFEHPDEVIEDFFQDFDKRIEGDHQYPVPPERRSEFLYLRKRMRRFADLAPQEFLTTIANFFESNPDLMAKVMGEDADGR